MEEWLFVTEHLLWWRFVRDRQLLQGSNPFSETNFQNFSRPQRVFSNTHNTHSIFLSCWISPSGCSSMSFKKTLLLDFTNFQDFQEPPTIFKYFTVLENARLKFKYFTNSVLKSGYRFLMPACRTLNQSLLPLGKLFWANYSGIGYTK